jgi:HSP20 family protein
MRYALCAMQLTAKFITGLRLTKPLRSQLSLDLSGIVVSLLFNKLGQAVWKYGWKGTQNMRKFVFGSPHYYASVGENPVWKPAVESLKTADGYVVRFDLPGVDPKDVDISVEENVLTVKGEREKKFASNGEDGWYNEAAYGKFHRTFGLPKDVDSEAIRATYEHGVLEVKIPLVAKAVARKIPVAVDDAPNRVSEAA